MRCGSNRKRNEEEEPTRGQEPRANGIPNLGGQKGSKPKPSPHVRARSRSGRRFMRDFTTERLATSWGRGQTRGVEPLTRSLSRKFVSGLLVTVVEIGGC